ncbi:hypothetical protein KBB08_02215 [Candidatus Gracilibacteria bacterium]|nr:hypothetical protein [Candidatus Gracilibacteria bacterium]
MNLRCLPHQQLLIVTDHAKVLVISDQKQFASLQSAHTPDVVVSFDEIGTKLSNRDVLVCDWPGEYEKSDVSVISTSSGNYVLTLDGRSWLVTTDRDVAQLDPEAEHLNSVECLLVWLTDRTKKADVQKVIDHLEPACIVYVVGEDNYGPELVPPAPMATSELALKASDWQVSTEQALVRTLTA